MMLDRQPAAPAYMPSVVPSTAAPSSYPVSPTQRRRSSAAHTRPANPPPNQPIPSVPLSSLDTGASQDDTHAHDYFNTAPSGSSLFIRPTASPNLAAVAAFSQARQTTLGFAHSSAQQSASSSVENLSDPPPRSYLPSASSRALTQHQDIVPDRLLLSPPEPRMQAETRPSSRRTLTRALDLAREAVKLDSTNTDPFGAVIAYGQSVALLSEVMERVRRGEGSQDTSRRRNGRRRSVVAQEEEVKRLKSIHDTYADRMNILSLIYSIPPQPHSTALLYSRMSTSNDSTQPSSPTSTSPSSETSEAMSSDHSSVDHIHASSADYVDMDFVPGQDDGSTPIDSAVFSGDYTFQSTGRPTAVQSTANPPSSYHPYASTSRYDHLPETVITPPSNAVLPSAAATTVRHATLTRRPRASSSLPPPPPPPSNSPPPAPATNALEQLSDAASSQVPWRPEAGRPRGNSTSGHQRTGSGSRLAALEEEIERADATPVVVDHPQRDMDPRRLIADTPRTQKRESHPLPPLPSPSSVSTMSSPGTPRNHVVADRQPSSPRSSHFGPRPRGASTLSVQSDASSSSANLINPSPTMGTISQRRSTKTSAPPSLRSPSPVESTASSGSVPVPRSLSSAGTTSLASVGSRGRAWSQPGVNHKQSSGDRTPPLDPRPPMPATSGSNVARNFSSKLNPNPPLSQQMAQADLPVSQSASISAMSLVPPPPIYLGNLPTTPTSPYPPTAPNDPLRKPYHMMTLLRTTMTSQTGGYVTRRLHVPTEVWSQGGAKLTNVPEKVRVVEILCSALEDLQISSSEVFGPGNVSSGLGSGIGSIGRKEGEAWIAKLEDFLFICDGVVSNFGKKLGVGEGFVLKKTTGVTSWGGKLTRRLDKLTNGKNLDSPAAYVQGLKQLFLLAQLLDEHTKAALSHPVAPTYSNLPLDIRTSAETKLKRASEFFASVALTFVIRDLSQLLDKYAKKCEKWLAE